MKLTDWQSVTHAELPFTLSISDNAIKAIILHIPADIGVLRFPCHSQEMQRSFNLVTESLAAVCSNDA